jgi:hypothetical protein
VSVVEGLLVCVGCDRWYPVRRGLPEVLPDHLRDWDEDRRWLEAHRAVTESAGLEAAWPLLDARRTPSAGVTDVNRGDTIWLAETREEIGEVHLGAQLFDEGRRMLKEDYARVKLPHDVAPGQSIRLRCALPPLLQPGAYLIELDMVDTQCLWFKEYAYQPVPWPVRVEGNRRDPVPGALVADWPLRIVPEQLDMPDDPEPVEILPAVPPAPRGLPRVVMDVWRTEGIAAVGRRILARLRRLSI